MLANTVDQNVTTTLNECLRTIILFVFDLTSLNPTSTAPDKKSHFKCGKGSWQYDSG